MRAFVVPGADEAIQRALVAALQACGHDAINDALAPWRAPPLAQAERQVFLGAVDRMLEAELLVADVSAPSAAAGWCVAWFLAKGRLCVLTCRRDARAALTPMLSGNPSPWQKLVVYDGPNDLAASLRALLG